MFFQNTLLCLQSLDTIINSCAKTINLENKLYKIGFTQNGLNSLVFPDDEYGMNFILQNENEYINNYEKMFREMGTVLVRYKVDNRQLRLDTNDQSLMKNQEQNDDSIHLICSNKTMKICQVFQLAEKEIKWGWGGVENLVNWPE